MSVGEPDYKLAVSASLRLWCRSDVPSRTLQSSCRWSRQQFLSGLLSLSSHKIYRWLKCWLLQDYCELRYHVKELLLEKLFLCPIGIISDLSNHSLLEIVRCAFYAGPNQASPSWKDWSVRAGGRHFPILRLSRFLIILVLWSVMRVMVMHFGGRWEIFCLLWWLFKFTTKILNTYQFELLPGDLTKMFPTLGPAWQVRQEELHQQLTRSQAILIPNTFQLDNLSPDQSLVFSSWTLIENEFWHLCSHMDQTPEILQEL